MNTVIKLEKLLKHQRESLFTEVRFCLVTKSHQELWPIKILVSVVMSFVAKEEGAWNAFSASLQACSCLTFSSTDEGAWLKVLTVLFKIKLLRRVSVWRYCHIWDHTYQHTFSVLCCELFGEKKMFLLIKMSFRSFCTGQVYTWY